MGDPDRVNRRQVEHREAHRRDRREPTLSELERAAPGRHGTLRPGEHLVPGRVAGHLTLDPHRIRAGDGGVAEVGSAAHQPHGGFAGGELDPRLGCGGRAELGGEAGERPAIGLGDDGQIRPRGGQGGAVGEIQLDVDTRLEPDRQVAGPASPDVEDPHHGEAPGSQPPRLDPREVRVLRLGFHGHLDHPGRRGVARQRAGARPVPDPGEQGIMPVGKRARRHANRQSAGGLGRELAAVDGWPDVFDDHSPPIAEHPVGDGVAHRIHVRPKVASQASRRDKVRNGPSRQSP